jgi:hypothetical protein
MDNDYTNTKELMIGCGLQDFFLSDAQGLGPWGDQPNKFFDTIETRTTSVWVKPRDTEKDAETNQMIESALRRRAEVMPILRCELEVTPNLGTQLSGEVTSGLPLMVSYRLPERRNLAGKLRTERWLLWAPTLGCFVTIKDEHEKRKDFLNITGKEPLSVRPGQWLRLLQCFLPKAPVHKVGICPCGNVHPFRSKCEECK